MEGVKGIATGTPVWVWPLLIVLTVVGFNSTRQRVSPVWIYYLIPLLGIFALRALARLPAPPEIWGMFAASYGVGALTGWRLQPRWIIERTKGHVALRGEALTLVVILTIFAANFVIGTLQAVAPQVVGAIWFQIGFVLIEGVAAGTFLGRGLANILGPHDPGLTH